MGGGIASQLSLLHWPSCSFGRPSPSVRLHLTNSTLPCPFRRPRALSTFIPVSPQPPPSITPATTLLLSARAESSFRASPCCLEPRFPIRPLSKSPSLPPCQPSARAVIHIKSSLASRISNFLRPTPRPVSIPSSHPYFPVDQHQRQRHCACPLATAHLQRHAGR